MDLTKTKFEEVSTNGGILELTDEIINEIYDLKISEIEKNKLINKLSKLKERLKI